MNSLALLNAIPQLLEAHTVPVVVGATASGKTGLIMRLVQVSNGKAPFEVISADAFQVYRKMDVGTAKPSPEILSVLPHHLINIKGPEESFSAGEFVERAEEIIGELIDKGRIPIVCGGSGLYVTSLISGFHELPGGDEELRASGLAKDELLERLRLHDPESAEELRDSTTVRITRRIEIVEGTGRRYREVRELERKKPKFTYEVFKMEIERTRLHARINARVGTMLEHGWIEEVRTLRAEGVTRESPSQRAIGYREIHAFLDGALHEAELMGTIAAKTRQYAKRQETWFRHQLKGRVSEVKSE